jgi:uncharacterized protein YceK
VKPTLIVLLALLTGCQTIREHPRTTQAIVSVVMVSAMLAMKHKGDPVYSCGGAIRPSPDWDD